MKRDLQYEKKLNLVKTKQMLSLKRKNQYLESFTALLSNQMQELRNEITCLEKNPNEEPEKSLDDDASLRQAPLDEIFSSSLSLLTKKESGNKKCDEGFKGEVSETHTSQVSHTCIVS